MLIIDLSYWEPRIDWAKIKVPVIIRAGGGLYEDPFLHQHVAGAISAGRPFSFYWAFDPRWDPELQATKFWNAAGKYEKHPLFGLPLYGPKLVKVVWGDYERNGGLSVYSLGPRIKRNLAKIEALWEWSEVGVYTRKTWWDSCVGTAAVWARNFLLWTAHYALPRPGVPWVPLVWRLVGWVLWQYTDRGIMEGISNPNGSPTGVDFNCTRAT